MKKKEILKILEKRSDYLKMHRPDVYKDIDGEINEIKGMLVALSDDDDVTVPEFFASEAKLAICEQTEVIKTFVELSSAVKAVATQKSLAAYSDAYQAVRGGLDHPKRTAFRWAFIILFGLSAVILIVLSFMKLSGKNIEWLPFPIEWVPEIVGIVDLSFGVVFFIFEQISDMNAQKAVKKSQEEVEKWNVICGQNFGGSVGGKGNRSRNKFTNIHFH